jgi:hypothetical protein
MIRLKSKKNNKNRKVHKILLSIILTSHISIFLVELKFCTIDYEDTQLIYMVMKKTLWYIIILYFLNNILLVELK